MHSKCVLEVKFFFLVSVYYCSWYSDKATLWMLWGFESRQGQKIFCSPNIHAGPGAHQTFCSIGARKFFSFGGGVKQSV